MLFEHFRQQLDGQERVQVFLDRRVGQRRGAHAPRASDRRVRDRRRPSPEKDVTLRRAVMVRASPEPTPTADRAAASSAEGRGGADPAVLVGWFSSGQERLAELDDLVATHRRLLSDTIATEARRRRLVFARSVTDENTRRLASERAELMKVLGTLATPGADPLDATIRTADVAGRLDVAFTELPRELALLSAHVRETAARLLRNVHEARQQLETLRSKIGARGERAGTDQGAAC